MTWRKTGSEFDDQCADVELSDAAYRTHMEAIGYLYKTEAKHCRIAKTALRRFATSDDVQEGIRQLVAVGFWQDCSTHFEVIHHADVISDSLDAQQSKRDRDRVAQQRARERKSGQGDRAQRPGVSADVIADTRQTDRQTDKQLGTGVRTTCSHGVRTEFWACNECSQEVSA